MITTSFRFQAPMWLLLLGPLLLVVLWAIRRQKSASVLYSSIEILKTLPATWALRVKQLLPWLRFTGLALVILALARPQFGRDEFRIRTEGIAIEMCIDQSGSMQAHDFELEGRRVNRLAVVKDVFRDFVAGTGGLEGRPNDLIGLISFGGFADSKCPLTLDHGALLAITESVEIPEPVYNARNQIVNQRLLEEELATAIGDAVALAVERLKDIEAKSKIILLLSDGENTAGVIEPLQAAEVAKTFGIKIYTIGVGSTGPAPFPVVDAFGRKAFRSQLVRLDEATLTKMAEITGGRYFNAKDTDTLKEVYADIDQLEKTLSEGRLYTEYREIYQYALFPGIALVLLGLVLVSTRFRSLP